MIDHLDPITLGVLRHRLEAIGDEMSTTTIRMSGSSVVFEANDFNIAIMNPDGDAIVFGIYIATHSSVLTLVTKNVIRDFKENPGIRPGDMFFTNDPFSGTLHANDGCLVTPVFWEGDIIAWAGVLAHNDDVGGPTPASFCPNARDMFEDPRCLPTFRLVEQDVIRKDLLAMWMSGSRVPYVLEGNILAQVAACRAARRGIEGLIRRLGVETVKRGIAELLERTAELFGNRIRLLPEGTWTSTTYIDRETSEGFDLYPVKLTLTKKDDRLIFDWTGTAPQMPGPVNCTMSAAKGAVDTAILAYLMWDIPRVPGAIWRNIELIAPPGTIVNAQPPAATSYAVAAWRVAVNRCYHLVGEMLAASDDPELRHRAQACWGGTMSATGWKAISPMGFPVAQFTSFQTECGGSGGYADRDGADSGGYANSPTCVTGNLEIDEQFLPCLYFFWRETKDSGGAGKFRGGNGTEVAYFPHAYPSRIPIAVLGYCAEVPHVHGLGGGYPGGMQRTVIFRGLDGDRLLREGKMPRDRNELLALAKERGIEPEPTRTIDSTEIGPKDVILQIAAAGGGYGDPLDRDPAAVAKDVRLGNISKEVARDVYCTALDANANADQEATEELRRQAKVERLR